MNKRQSNYRRQNIKCCFDCKHVREIQDKLFCSLLSKDDNNVEHIGICDSYKYWGI